MLAETHSFYHFLININQIYTVVLLTVITLPINYYTQWGWHISKIYATTLFSCSLSLSDDLEQSPSCLLQRSGGGLEYSSTNCTTLCYRCSHGHREVYKCLDGYLFNTKTGHCEEQINVTCIQPTSDPCKRQGDGTYANYSTSCQDYYRYMHLQLFINIITIHSLKF